MEQRGYQVLLTDKLAQRAVCGGSAVTRSAGKRKDARCSMALSRFNKCSVKSLQLSHIQHIEAIKRLFRGSNHIFIMYSGTTSRQQHL